MDLLFPIFSPGKIEYNIFYEVLVVKKKRKTLNDKAFNENRRMEIN